MFDFESFHSWSFSFLSIRYLFFRSKASHFDRSSKLISLQILIIITKKQSSEFNWLQINYTQHDWWKWKRSLNRSIDSMSFRCVSSNNNHFFNRFSFDFYSPVYKSLIFNMAKVFPNWWRYKFWAYKIEKTMSKLSRIQNLLLAQFQCKVNYDTKYKIQFFCCDKKEKKWKNWLWAERQWE